MFNWGEQLSFEKIQVAISKVFEPDELEQFMLHRMKFRIDDAISVKEANNPTICFRLLDWAERQGRTDEFISKLVLWHLQKGSENQGFLMAAKPFILKIAKKLIEIKI